MHALLAQPHHDGSEAYVPETPAELGDDVTVLLRVPKASFADAVAVRYVRDGEPQIARAEVDRETDATTSGGVRRSPSGTSRRRIAGSCPAATSATRGSTRWACSPPTSPTRTTSSVSPGAGGPDWHLESVVYEVFPDRFASSGARRHAAGVGDPARLGRAPDRARARDAGRVVRRRSPRDRGAPRPPDVARSERALRHSGLPRAKHASLRRHHVRLRRPAARR